MWFDRRLFGVRAVNRTVRIQTLLSLNLSSDGRFPDIFSNSQGPESWINSRGTEHIIVEGHSARARAEEQRAAAVEAQ